MKNIVIILGFFVIITVNTEPVDIFAGIESDMTLQYGDDFIQSTRHFAEEIIAQAACQAHGQFGRVYAVGKQCRGSKSTCNDICASSSLHSQDSQTAKHKWSCIAAFHVYYGRPSTTGNGQTNTAKLGLKSKREQCTYLGCGPNFCCCSAE